MKDQSNYDLVQKPKHYNRENAIQCIDEMILVFGEEATMHFCLLNCWKYRYRSGLKDNGYQDLEKSDWYMRKYKELKEKIENNKTPNSIRIPYKPNIDPWVITTNGAKTNEN